MFSTFHARVEYISGENSLFRLLPLLRYNLTSHNSLLLRVMKPKHRTDMVYIFVHFSSTPILILNLTMSSESQESDVSIDILSEWKYSQLFTQESNIFLLKQLYQANRFTDAAQQWRRSLFIDCSQMDGRTETQWKQYICQFTPFTWRI